MHYPTSEEIGIFKSIQKGCLISLKLYVMVVEALEHLL
jgi:hypothetical protein